MAPTRTPSMTELGLPVAVAARNGIARDNRTLAVSAAAEPRKARRVQEGRHIMAEHRVERRRRSQAWNRSAAWSSTARPRFRRALAALFWQGAGTSHRSMNARLLVFA